ncbi:MAG TPA: hypothetical protein VGI10_14745 [Polyangiaceae bacterium]|jgi:hypothetical protein
MMNRYIGLMSSVSLVLSGLLVEACGSDQQTKNDAAGVQACMDAFSGADATATAYATCIRQNCQCI